MVILLFLGICVWIFYDAFYPSGIPQHLKEDDDESGDEGAPSQPPAANNNQNNPAAANPGAPNG